MVRLQIIFVVLGMINFPSFAQRDIPAPYSSSAPVNYVRTWDVVAPDTNPTNLNMNTAIEKARVATQYFDGLGRPLQTVIKQGSLITGGTARDIVSAVEYDAFGRESVQYLPFPSTATDGKFKLNPFQQQAAFYNNANPENPLVGQGEIFFYGQTKFEPSPLNRVNKTMAPGNSWSGAGRGVTIKYHINTAADAVRIWNVTDAAIGVFGSYQSTGVYDPGQLYKNITEDEHGKQVIEFKDKEDRVVLKKVQLTAPADDGTGRNHSGGLCTYYIYDDFGSLRCVIQPAGVELISSTWSLSSGVLAEQCFRYEYDERRRMIVKKVPGAGEVNMVYDKRDRLVMTQDANLKAAGKWMVTKYDELNRPAETGLWTNAGLPAGHRNNAKNTWPYPAAPGSYELLTQTFYDDYSWVGSSGSNITNSDYEATWNSHFLPVSNTVWPYAQANVKTSQTKGMVTGTKTKVLGTPSAYLFTLTIYDSKGRPIQIKSSNITGGIDVITTQYSWSGQPLIMVQKQQVAGAGAQTTVMVNKNDYDKLGRLVKISKRVSNNLTNGGAMSGWAIVSEMEYDALGQQKKKKLGKNPVTGQPLETLEFDYNIRGWILGMNRLFARDGTQNNYFGFHLGYDKTDNKLIGSARYLKPQYNGNISGTVWKSKGDGEKRKYDYGYDAANRLMKADFGQYTSGSFNRTAGVDFSMKMGDGSSAVSAYDANGNIKAMTQSGLKVNASSTIDSLSYTYLPGANKLSRVTDAANDFGSMLGDFKYDPVKKGTTDYSYDANGNLIRDGNKSISAIAYNHLNLPVSITIAGKGVIVYTYDAAGNKLQKTVTDNSVLGKTIKTITTYVGGAVFESRSSSPVSAADYANRLEFIAHEEGRLRPVRNAAGAVTALVYDYFLKDHLGNVRMVLTEEQKSDLYPPATMETASAAVEEALYGNVSNTRSDKPPGYPADSYTNPNNKVAKVSGSGQKTGPSLLLKVMAGDKFNLRVSSWYRTGGAVPAAPKSLLPDLVASFLSSFAGGGGGLKEGVSGALLQSSGVITTAATGFLNNRAYSSVKPKAYVSWMLLDEQFKLVAGSSGAEQVGGDGEFKVHVKTGLGISKNGYLYVYVSNETPNVNVFFDNLQVTHVRGPVLEETHYYPFGLTMAGISSKAMDNIPKNKEKTFQGQRFDDDLGLNWVQFKWRNHDPQSGRFIEIDPLSEKYVYNSTYAFSENKVINSVELEGLEAVLIIDKAKKELQSNFQTLANWFDNALGYLTQNSNSTEVLSTPLHTISVGTTTTNTTSTNFGGNMEYIITHNSNAENTEPLTKTVTKITIDQTTEVKTTGGAITNKTSVDNNGVVTQTTGGKTDIKLRGVPVTVSGTIGKSTDGKTTFTVQGSSGTTTTKGVVNAQYHIDGKSQSITVGGGIQEKTGKTTTKSTFGINVKWW